MRTLLIGTLLLSLAGCGTFNKPDVPPTSLDTMATRIKTQLINDLPLAAAAINVDQKDGVIYLRGFADDEFTKRRIAAIARKTAGNRKVVDRVQIK